MSIDKPCPRTLYEAVQWRLERGATRGAYTLLDSEASETIRWTWQSLDAKANTIAALLVDIGAAKQRVVLLYSNELKFVGAFFGCIYAGCVAVPAYSVTAQYPHRALGRLSAILDDVKPICVLTDTETLDIAKRAGVRGTDYWHSTDRLSDSIPRCRPPSVKGNDPTIIQYTSGSTASPRGVVLSHDNVLANEQMLAEAHGYDEESTLVGWVPLAHDWGLITSVIQAAYSGAHSVLLPTQAFLSKPLNWFRAISRYQRVTSGGPNFAFELALRRIRPEECQLRELSSWDYAGVSAGPVSPDTLGRFANQFEAIGFRRAAFYVSYGLAEATLRVSASSLGQFPRRLIADRDKLEKQGELVKASDESLCVSQMFSCGEAGARVVIVTPSSNEKRRPGEVGEVCVSGKSVAAGYWNKPEVNAATFGLFVDGEVNGPFLRTGDYGAIVDGELYIVGRIKDMIIANGRNIFPQDIEATIDRCHAEIRAGCGIAFGLKRPGSVEEALVIVQESKRESPSNGLELVDQIRRSVFGEHNVVAQTVVLIEKGTIQKTSSGKLRRSACREAYQQGQLAVVLEHSVGPTEQSPSNTPQRAQLS